MMTIEEKRRELFEAWCMANNMPFLSRCTEPGYTHCYANPVYQGRWEGFNAALDAVVLELPQKVEPDPEIGEEYDDYAMGANCMRRHCVKAIESIGLGLKVRQ